MKHKFFEIRDRATCIPVLAISTYPDNKILGSYVIERLFFKYAGFGTGSKQVYLVKLETGGAEYDPFKWGDKRTMLHAHRYIEEYFDDLVSGQVIDVETILGEKEDQAEPEIVLFAK